VHANAATTTGAAFGAGRFAPVIGWDWAAMSFSVWVWAAISA